MRFQILLYLLLIIAIAHVNYAYSSNYEYVKAIPAKGDGVNNILLKFGLNASKSNLNEFKDLNSSKLSKRGNLVLGEKYDLPIKVVKYNGRSIRTTLGITDLEYAMKIQTYNEEMLKLKIRDTDFRKDKKLWVPLFDFVDEKEVISKENKSNSKKNKTEVIEPIFGKNYENIKVISNKLKGTTYYLDAGHGGPDPGAQSEKNGVTLSEDEYAYDVTLRLARNIIENGGDVYIIVQDPTDGIRDEAFLNNSKNELYIDAEEIPVNQLQRLRVRADKVNQLYYDNDYGNKKHHLICIHVDSRIQKNHQIDIFFYYKSSSKEGKKWAETLLNTIDQKYAKAQPNRGYTGSVTSRDELYMIRKTMPTTTYIELGNIQNQRDQQRIMEPNNRQAVANWLLEGLVNINKNEK